LNLVECVRVTHVRVAIIFCVQVDIKLDDRGVGEEDDEDDDEEEDEEGHDDEDDDGGLPFKMDEDGDGEPAGAEADTRDASTALGTDPATAAAAAPSSPTIAEQQQPQRTDSTAEKLDLMMDMLFEFINRQCRNRQDEAGQQQADDLFRAMMRVFNSIVLTT
jgi:hypothetical protein